MLGAIQIRMQIQEFFEGFFQYCEKGHPDSVEVCALWELFSHLEHSERELWPKKVENLL